MSKLKIKKDQKVFYKNEQYIVVKVIDFYSVLIQSIKNNNGELVILGYGEKWLGFNSYNKRIKRLG